MSTKCTQGQVSISPAVLSNCQTVGNIRSSHFYVLLCECKLDVKAYCVYGLICPSHYADMTLVYTSDFLL